MWMAVIDLADSEGTAVSLDPGLSTLTFTSSYFNKDHVVGIEILPGQGSPHQFESKGQLALFPDKFLFVEPAPQALVKVRGSLPDGSELGAAKYVFDIPNVDDESNPYQKKVAVAPARFASVEQVNFRVVQEASNSYGVPGTLVTIYLTAAEGLEVTQLSRFDFVVTSQLDAVNGDPQYWANYFVDTSTEYYDTDGVPISSEYLSYNVGVIE